MGILQKIMIDDVLHYSELPQTMTGRQWAEPVPRKCRVELGTHQDFGVDRQIGLVAGQVFVDTDDVKVGDLLWPGVMADKPVTPPIQFEVLKLGRVKNIRGTKIVRTAAFGTKGGGD